MSRNAPRRGRLKQVLLILAFTLVALVAAVAWMKPNAVKVFAEDPRRAANLIVQYVRPVDGRQRLATKKDGFNVLVLVLDACRADKFSAHGFDRETTPVLKSLLDSPDVTLFRRHYTNSNWTKPSTASLFTGMYVHEHGVFMPWRPSEGSGGRNVFKTQVLADEIETMAEIFADAGYYTFGIVQGYHLDPQFGFAQGFDEYYNNTYYPGDRRKLWATNALVEAIEGNFFGYVHMIGCHNSFPPSERHAGYMARYGFDYPEGTRIDAGVDFSNRKIIDLIKDKQIKLTDEDVKFLNLIYEAKTRMMEESFVEPMLANLKQTGRYDDTLIVITADHGESLYEHENYAHGGSDLWEELVHVPLIVKFPQGARPEALGPEVNELTSSVDLLPALAELLGRRVPEHARGAPIFGGTFADRVFTEGHSCAPAVGDCIISWAIVRDHLKLVDHAGEIALFDLDQDPSEQRSIAAQRPEALRGLQAAVADLRRGSSQAYIARQVETEIDQEAVRTLRGLGYIQ